MNLSVGIVGLPNVGKSTLFNALVSRRQANVNEYPFTTVEPNVGIVEVPDKRLASISRATKIKKRVPATIKFVDIAGLVKNAHLGEGLGNEFLGHIREVDLILHLIRKFENPQVGHIQGDINPKGDLEIVNTELILKDLETVEKKFSAVQKKLEISKEREDKTYLEALKRVKDCLNEGRPLINCELSLVEWGVCRELFLLTAKPGIYVLNISENQIKSDEEYRKKEVKIGDFGAIEVCAKLEADLAEIERDERVEYIHELGLKGSALDHIIHVCYSLLNLVTFFTIAKGAQVQAWPVSLGMRAYEAAGEVHTDFQRGFIKAEVVPWEELVKLGSFEKARAEGRIQLVGRDYLIKDGDVIEFKFNV